MYYAPGSPLLCLYGDFTVQQPRLVPGLRLPTAGQTYHVRRHVITAGGEGVLLHELDNSALLPGQPEPCFAAARFGPTAGTYETRRPLSEEHRSAPL